MKILLKVFSLVLLLSSIVLFNSCEREQDILSVENLDLLSENLEKQENLKSNIHYTNYVKARAELYHQMSNFNIDVFGIIDYQTRNRLKSVCEIDHSVLMTFQGGLLYQRLLCQDIKENLIQVYTKFEKEIETMTDEEMHSIFSYTPNNTVVRQQSCLDSFNNSINAGTQYCSNVENYSWCLDDVYEVAGNMYDDCCANGGSGCPPGLAQTPQEEHIPIGRSLNLGN